MTAFDLLAVARTNGILLQAQGDRLHVEAPPGALTPELRDQLVRHKPALLALLAPQAFVTLRGGLTLPVAAIEVALDLERRGFKMSLDQSRQFQIEPTANLTDEDRAAIARWRLPLADIIGYDAHAQGRTQ